MNGANKQVTAMQLDRAGEPLHEVQGDMPEPRRADLLIEVAACGVCRTDLHIVDGDIRGKLPIVPGHEVVGRVVAVGPEAHSFAIGDRVGVPWLGGTDGTCFYCAHGMENLCDAPTFTGFTRDGGYASHVLADSRYCLHIPDVFDDVHAAPLLCAGLIGYRALKLAGAGERLGFYGFGASAHILAQVATRQGREVFAFTRDGDTAGQDFARSLGCVWVGGSSEEPPRELDAAIIFAPAGPLVPLALTHVRKGGSGLRRHPHERHPGIPL
jgi:propanol-preferring alcohol dehydrogenase